MGARYVLCSPDTSPTDQGAKEIMESEGYRLYENPSPMGRITMVHRIAGFATNVDSFVAIIQNGFDYFSEAYVMPDDVESVRRFLGDPRMSARSDDVITNVIDQPNRNYSKVESNSASLMILNEWFTPAWKVRVNGVSQSALRVNQWQVGVLLPAGKNDVEFEYDPRYLEP